MSTTDTQETMTRATHEALLEKALRDATSTTEAALERKTEEASQAVKRAEAAEAKVAELETETARLNGELDSAQIDLKTATDKAAALEADIAAKAKDAEKAEIASKRAEAVTNLGLFSKEYVSEKASKWADIADDAWEEQLAEWRLLKPATEGDSASKDGKDSAEQDAASAMTGTTGSLTADQDAAASTKSPRRAALGLV